MIDKLPILILIAIASIACSSRDNTKSDKPEAVETTQRFDTDSAMSFLKAQTDFGPRVPGTEAHALAADYLVKTFQRLGADTVIVQECTVKAWNGDQLPLKNIRARFGYNPDVSPILLVSHWDSRPWADRESDPLAAQQPIDGANDGASGVAVLLEIARQASIHGTKLPIEILLVDGEDYGEHGEDGDESSWCLGTQAWLEANPYATSPKPRYSLLLDMVGGKDARFHREYISDTYARQLVDMIWQEAASIGLADRFINQPGGAVVDDHLFINRAGIPAIDIIESKSPDTGSFNATWHTLNDRYENIDPSAISDTGKLVSHLVIK